MRSPGPQRRRVGRRGLCSVPSASVVECARSEPEPDLPHEFALAVSVAHVPVAVRVRLNPLVAPPTNLEPLQIRTFPSPSSPVLVPRRLRHPRRHARNDPLPPTLQPVRRRRSTSLSLPLQLFRCSTTPQPRKRQGQGSPGRRRTGAGRWGRRWRSARARVARRRSHLNIPLPPHKHRHGPRSHLCLLPLPRPPFDPLRRHVLEPIHR